MGTTEQLWRLQELEEQLKEAKIQKKTFMDGKEIQGNIQEHKTLKKQFEETKTCIGTTKTDIQRLEGLLEDKNAQKEVNRGNLYGGKINDLKQLGVLLKDQEKMETEAVEIERELLKAIESLDVYEKSSKEAYDGERKLGGQIKKMLNDRQKSIEKIEKTIEDLTRQIEEVKVNINPKDLDTYEYIKGRKSRPVAQINEDICTGCNMDVPLMTITLLKKGNLATCDNCGRILHRGE